MKYILGFVIVLCLFVGLNHSVDVNAQNSVSTKSPAKVYKIKINANSSNELTYEGMDWVHDNYRDYFAFIDVKTSKLVHCLKCKSIVIEETNRVKAINPNPVKGSGGVFSERE